MNNEQKTPEQWFQQLKEPYRSEAIENINVNYHSFKKYPENLGESLSCSFYFTKTKQGHTYWWNICQSIKLGETTYLETELKIQDMISGEWYRLETNIFKFILKFKDIEGNYLYDYKCIRLSDKSKFEDTTYMCNIDKIKSIRPATREEVLEHFPDEFKDEKKEVESELKEGEVYFYWGGGNDNFIVTKDLELAINCATNDSIIYRATPIGTKQTKSFLEPIKK